MLGSLGTSLELRRWPFKNFSGSQGTFDGCQAFNCADGPVGGVRQMKPLSWFGAGQDSSFRRVRRTARMAPTAIGTRFGRASRRGLSDACQPQSSRIRIWAQGRARRRVGKSGLGTRSRARGTTLMLESAGGEPLHRLNLPTHGDRKTAWR